ncbi:MAG TPA: UvrD-helicase domain-containing protein, partial [Bacteroidota bacterium]|nr:UvrD-helicase domain-containing protein [Bacteroidota bacterium]
MLTQNQQKALDFRSHLSITANAGAGKTAVLVQRFIEILLRTPTRINEVVAITFTEKAASELRKKIAEKVEEGVHHAATPGEKQVFKRIRDELASAIIGTIHSFCARLLREYPVEADVDAAFTVLEGVDQRLLVEDALQETFELILSDNGASSQRSAFLDLVGMLGRTTVQQYLNVMLTRREQIERLIAGPLAENRPDEEILQERKSLLVLEASRRLEEGEWRKSLSRIVVEAKGKSAPEVKERLDQWTPTMDPAAMIAIYKQISDLVFTKKGTLREAFVGAGMEGSSTKTECEALSGFHAEIGQLISDLTDPLAAEAERGLLRSTRILLHLYRRCTEVYEVKKSQFGLLDFEDLQLKARGLLRNDEIRGRLAGKLKHIMVDEFQDTNRLQYEILQLLVSHYATGNLFIVGDPKQSIYGFRNAEVEVFEKARREIASSITLSESFRPLPNLAAFVNRVFSRLMGHSSSPFDVRYDELIKGRSETAAGGVELFLIPEDESDEPEPDNDPGKRSAVETECRMIARRIAELKNSNYLMYDRKHGTSPRHFEFDDAAVLLRDRRHVREIEKALFEFNIPYALSGGIGFYQTQEVSDILNYFRFLLNPDDDIALSGILRSPFFAISDAELYEISIEGEGNTLWQKALRHADRQQADRSLSRAVMVLTDNLSQVHRLSIPLLAQRIFLQTGWHGTLRGLPSGLQQVANIKKLIAIARDFEGKGSTTLYDFVERLTTLVAEQEREGQASVGSPGNCVHVMTIHAAKGLEFPVVFLPFTHQALRYDHPPYIDSDIGITFKVSEAPDSDEGSSSPLYNYLRSRSRARTANEEKRIFYVACTRARDLLILTGQHAEKPPSPSYLSWLFEGLGEEFDASREGMQTFQHSKLKVLVEENDRFTVKEIPHRLAVAVRFPDNTETVGTENPTIRSEFLEPPELLIDPLP